jgi:stage III sporulation protein SpoIIIAA
MATLRIIKEKFDKNGSTYPRSKIIIEETGELLENVSSWKITENGTKLTIDLFGFSIEEVNQLYER